MDKAIETANAATNTDTFKQIGIINTDKTKKKPYDVKVKKLNEPKIKPNILYSDKQNYRRYKTKTEPKLFSKIMVDDEEDLIAKIRKEFGIEDKTRKNYSEAETSGTPYYEEPNPTQGAEPNIVKMLRFDDSEITDISRNEIEDILGELITNVENRLTVGDIKGLTLASGADIGNVADEDLLPIDDEEEPEPLSRRKSGLTELSALTTKAGAVDLESLSIEDLYTLRDNFRGKLTPGQKPSNPDKIEKRRKELIEEIQKYQKERGVV